MFVLTADPGSVPFRAMGAAGDQVELKGVDLPSGGFSFLAGGLIGFEGTIGPNAAQQVAGFGVSATRAPTMATLLLFGSFDVSTVAGPAAIEVEIFIDGAPAPQACVLYSGVTPAAPGDAVVYTVTLSGDLPYIFADLAVHTFAVIVRTDANTSVKVKGASGTLRLYGNVVDFA